MNDGTYIITYYTGKLYIKKVNNQGACCKKVYVKSTITSLIYQTAGNMLT